MSFFENFDWSFKSIAKILGLLFLGVVVISIVIALFSFAFRTVFQATDEYSPSYYGDGYDTAAYDRKMVPSSSPSGYFEESQLPSQPATGTTAEDFEVKTYDATVQTRRLEKVCAEVSDLKKRTEVIFETANSNENSCTFRFKVKKEKEAEIVAFVETLKPDNLNVNVQSIKGTLDDYDKQLDILEKKLASIEDTLEKAQAAYDEVSDLATRKQDVESLAKIIDNKLTLIEKMTTERMAIKQQIDSYHQSKADQADRLNFSFFNVNVIKDVIFDWKEIKESWKWEFRAFVENFNNVLQGLSVNLATYFVRFFQVAIYFFLSLFLLKYLWIATKRIWKGRDRY